jgi:hypothetical protein
MKLVTLICGKAWTNEAFLHIMSLSPRGARELKDAGGHPNHHYEVQLDSFGMLMWQTFRLVSGLLTDIALAPMGAFGALTGGLRERSPRGFAPSVRER